MMATRPTVQPNPADPTDPYARQAQIFPTLSDEQITRCLPFGQCQTLPQGTVLFERGDRTVDFFVVLEGCIEIYEHQRKGLHPITWHKRHQFTGELDLFNNRQILVGGRMAEDGQVLRIRRSQFRRLITAEPEIGEIIMRALILRRTGLISHKQASVTLVTSEPSADALRIERFLRRNGYPLDTMTVEAFEADHASTLSLETLSPERLPAVFIHQDETVLYNPSTEALAETLGLVETLPVGQVYDVAIVGAGPAGLSAAVYAASEGLDVVLLESEAPGGQASTSSKIENYLGFPTGVSGQELASRAQIQAEKFGARMALLNAVTGIDCQGNPFALSVEGGKEPLLARTVVLACGACYRRLGFDHPFDNAGVYYAATAMETSLCTNDEVIVVGGGNSAGQAAVFLAGYASHVHVLVRGDSLAASMSDYLIERIQSSQSITLHTHTEIVALKGTTHLEEVTLKHRETGQTQTRPVRHVFLMIGAQPNTAWLKDCLALDDKGFILTGPQVAAQATHRPAMLETSIAGIFAVGDVRSGSIKRVASAVGEGAMAISHVHQALASQFHQRQTAVAAHSA